MNFEQFVEYVRTHIKECLGDSYKDAEILIEPMKASHCIYNGMIVRAPGQKMAPVINLDNVYTDYCNGGDIEDMMLEMARTAYMSVPSVSADFQRLASDYEFAKSRLTLRLSNYESRKEFFDNVPHRKILDLAVSYHIAVDGLAPNAFSGFTITNDMLKSYNKTEETLYEDALKYAPLNQPAHLENLGVMMGQGKSKINVLSNEDGVFGASAIFYPDVLNDLSEGEPLYILPSSIHEVLVLKAKDEDANRLSQIVSSANEATVPKEETLSGHVYKYENGELQIEV